jgi:hypothetical protein
MPLAAEIRTMLIPGDFNDRNRIRIKVDRKVAGKWLRRFDGFDFIGLRHGGFVHQRGAQRVNFHRRIRGSRCSPQAREQSVSLARKVHDFDDNSPAVRAGGRDGVHRSRRPTLRFHL